MNPDDLFTLSTLAGDTEPCPAPVKPVAQNNPSVEQHLAAWAAQAPDVCRVSPAQHEFIAAMRKARAAGVGYGWMRQIIGVEWTHIDPVGGIDDGVLLRLYGQEPTP